MTRAVSACSCEQICGRDLVFALNHFKDVPGRSVEIGVPRVQKLAIQEGAEVDCRLPPGRLGVAFVNSVVAQANEDKKSLETFTFMLDELKRTDPLRRSEPILCVGGGVLTDTAGFACACWRRGRCQVTSSAFRKVVPLRPQGASAPGMVPRKLMPG